MLMLVAVQWNEKLKMFKNKQGKKQKIMERSKENLKIKSQEDFLEEIDPNSHKIMPLNVKRSIIERIWVMLRGFVVMYSMRRYSKYRAKVIKESTRRSKEEVQIMEHRGEMYICCRGIPIVREEDLGAPWGGVLARSRESYKRWLIEREMEK